jgi:hypothetical protein
MRIFDYAVVANWSERLDVLAEVAEPERWNFASVPSPQRLPILGSYLRYTFLRVHEQTRVLETEKAACFNTGLLTPGQEEIFGLFTVSEHFDPAAPVAAGNKKWFFKGWARAGDKQLTGFANLPSLATYWTEPSDLVLNPALNVQLNVDHIIRDNLPRFPQELGGQLDPNGVPKDLTAEPDIEDDDEDDAAGQSDIPDIPLATRNALEGAMKHSIRLAQRSYRIAVPQFHKGRIQLLLPLYLRDSNRADLALTLERHGDWYRAATVLYPDWAYMHARLLTRPNSEWLGGWRTDLQTIG